ncbi:MAG: hypothetical protein ABI960_01880 [Candidatus Eisenbacteria bacterium]
MTERTLTGKPRRRGRAAGARRATGKKPAPLTHLGALPWAMLLLTFSVALAAAAVFTRKPF